ncbi:hypothetical protein HK107_01235 [Parvularcula sp. ZS-1/3]|uniref:Peptidoglycan binding-like domain-containing protein n=1 Tax=Parvularcula mediterranea TaxID=2732508 RepID=A0A7Y3W3N7_9PROT|nr:hypothetical protein [Parvularcula mediterranea]NNU14945.1 hypothetical protein [Parvularcula mediterranea]
MNSFEISRRLFLAGATSTFAFQGRSFAVEGDEKLSPDEVLAELLDAADPYSNEVDTKGVTKRDAMKTVKATSRAMVDWYAGRGADMSYPTAAAYDRAPDTAHLNGLPMPSGKPFKLTHGALQILADGNHFALSDEMPRTLFGLRGCIPAAGQSLGFAKSHLLRPAKINHTDLRCTLGIWDREREKVAVFLGSTVPHAANMWLQVNRVSGANMLLSGLYHYQVGLHGGSGKSPQRGAFKLRGSRFENADGSVSGTERVVVLRTVDNMTYDPTSSDEIWHECTPWDNIHSAIYDHDLPRGKTDGTTKYNSAGCQIVKGDYLKDSAGVFTNKPRGPWADFRKAAGLSDPPTESENGRDFQYMLLSGAEAALATERARTMRRKYRRIRFGSSGDAVAELQTKLGITPDGKMGPGSTIALILEQIARSERETGIATV